MGNTGKTTQRGEASQGSTHQASHKMQKPSPIQEFLATESEDVVRLAVRTFEEYISILQEWDEAERMKELLSAQQVHLDSS